jgi:hypothetical protein
MLEERGVLPSGLCLRSEPVSGHNFLSSFLLSGSSSRRAFSMPNGSNPPAMRRDITGLRKLTASERIAVKICVHFKTGLGTPKVPISLKGNLISTRLTD